VVTRLEDYGLQRPYAGASGKGLQEPLVHSSVVRQTWKLPQVAAHVAPNT
jgi:hypothetical protein